ncbi:MAG: helix-turn-helix domain-containing protein [Clostridia bacterium]|nr:helix-turn-helix domain-containing protein [Clostridia bacterium]
MKSVYSEFKGFSVERKKFSKKHSMGTPHYHHAYEIFLPLEGQMTLLIGDEMIATDNANIILADKEIAHGNYSKSEHERMVIYFDDDFLNMFLTDGAKNALLKCFSQKLVAPSRDELKRARRIAYRLEKTAVKEENLEEIFRLLTELLLIINNAPEGKRGESRSINSTLGSTIAYLNLNFSKVQSIKEVSDRFYITESYLCRLFKEGMGITVSEYINVLKINDACDKLRNTDLSATEICYEVGYNSYTYFSKNFQRRMKETPHQYRKKHKV